MRTVLLNTVAALGMLCGLAARAARGADAPDVPAGYTNVALAAEDAAGLSIVRAGAQPWCVALDGAGRPLEVTGCVQEAVCRGVRVRLQYGLFGSAAAARAAARFHVAHVAAAFQPGLWRGAGVASVGDESWWTQSGAPALLVRSGPACVLVGGHAPDRAGAEAVARVIEELAVRAVARARAAASADKPAVTP